MSFEIEIIISVFKDGKFFSLDKIKANDFIKAQSQLEFVFETARNKAEKVVTEDDDDIPF